MAKHQKTLYIEKDLYNYVIDYQKKNGLSNFNIAIERILLERIFAEQGNLNNGNINNYVAEVKENKPKNKLLDNIRKSMPD